MRVMSVIAFVAACSLGLVLFGSAQPPAPPATQGQAGPGSGTSRRPSWPPAPAPARVRFLRSLNPATFRPRTSLMSRVVGMLAGRKDDERMLQPYGIAVGPDGRVYVADTFGRAIHVYDLAKASYSTIAVNGESLIGVGVAGDRLFVTDSTSGRLLCVDAKGRVLWSRGPKDGFERPTGIATAGDRLYVVDTARHRVVIVTTAGAIVGAFGERGAAPGQFNYPTNIARSEDGRLYVTDTMNFRVQIFDPDGHYVAAFGQLGDGSGDFDKPKGIAVDSNGHIYVVEGLNDVVQIFDESGKLLLVFGGSGSGDGEFWLPSGIAIANDTIFVADSANKRVEMFEYLADGR